MEFAVLVGIVGAALGCAIAFFLFGIDLIIGTSLMTEERAIGIIIVSAIVTPAVSWVICMMPSPRPRQGRNFRPTVPAPGSIPPGAKPPSSADE